MSVTSLFLLCAAGAYCFGAGLARSCPDHAPAVAASAVGNAETEQGDPGLPLLQEGPCADMQAEP